MKQMTHLTLHLQNCMLGNESISMIFQGLKGLGKVKDLDLNITRNNITKENDLSLFLKNIDAGCLRLKINFGINKIGDDNIVTIFRSLLHL